jgi:hypothetical protein
LRHASNSNLALAKLFVPADADRRAFYFDFEENRRDAILAVGS